MLTERAEYLTAEDMLSLALIDNRNVFAITDYLTNDLTHTKFYLGAKGLGKTLTAMKSVNDLLKENAEVIPSFILFQALGRPYLLDSLNLATEETWGDRLSFFTEAEPDLGYFLENSDIIILDDLHYMVEAVVQGTLKPELFIHLLETVLQKADEGKKVLLISEAPLNVYADELDWRELDVLLPRLGQPPISTANNDSFRQRWIKSLKKTVDYVAAREILPLSMRAFWNLCEVYNIDIDDGALEILWAIGSRPRNFLKFCNLFGEKTITTFDIIAFTREKLKTMKRSRGLALNISLLDHPEYEFQTPPRVISYILKRKPEFIAENWDNIKWICDTYFTFIIYLNYFWVHRIAMESKRNNLEINADILRVAQGGALKTHIVYGANLNFEVVKGYLERLIGSGLLRHDPPRYYATEKGVMYLTRFNSLVRCM